MRTMVVDNINNRAHYSHNTEKQRERLSDEIEIVQGAVRKALFAKSVVKHDFRWPRPATERVSVQQLIHGPSSETIPDNLRDSV